MLSVSRIHVKNLPEGYKKEQYVSGVYVQVTYDSLTKEFSYDYSLPRKCAMLYPDLETFSIEDFKEYECPSKSMKLEGQISTSQDSQSFYYVVNSCQSMNTIRDKLGIEQVECQDYDTILE